MRIGVVVLPYKCYVYLHVEFFSIYNKKFARTNYYPEGFPSDTGTTKFILF